MKKYYVFLNVENGAIVLISANNPDFLFYEESHQELKNGNKRDCVDFIYEYQDENLIPDDAFLFTEVK